MFPPHEIIVNETNPPSLDYYWLQLTDHKRHARIPCPPRRDVSNWSERDCKALMTGAITLQHDHGGVSKRQPSVSMLALRLCYSHV